jgi:hypothetical protein
MMGLSGEMTGLYQRRECRKQAVIVLEWGHAL